MPARPARSARRWRRFQPSPGTSLERGASPPSRAPIDGTRRAEASLPLPRRESPGKWGVVCALALLVTARGAGGSQAVAAESAAAEPPPAAASAPPAAAPPAPAAPAPAPSGLTRWLDPATAPFIPIPAIDVEPHSGLTLGVIPTSLRTSERDEIERITAPDLIHSQYFGWGAHMRVFGFPSADTPWAV